MQRLSRRQFVAGTGAVGLLAGCGRLPGQPEQPGAKVARLGVLNPEGPGAVSRPADPFWQGLRDHGYVEGQNLIVERRYAEAQVERLPKLATELVELRPDVILTSGTDATRAAHNATTTVPIVMSNVGDPVGSGLVASLARPGGNVTGVSNFQLRLSGKRLELLRDTVPGLARVALLWNPALAERAHEFEEIAAAAQTLGLGLQSVELRHGGGLEHAFASILQGRADALLLQGNPVLNRYRREVADFSTAHRLPTMSSRLDYVAAGSLMSYGPDSADMDRRAAYYVDRILKGAKPADLPVEQPMRFDFVVNMKTARELGITFPHEVALQITEVIE